MRKIITGVSVPRTGDGERLRLRLFKANTDSSI